VGHPPPFGGYIKMVSFKDIKPTTVLVNSMTGQALLTGFEMSRCNATTFESYTG
jgi:hypothetical protein